MRDILSNPDNDNASPRDPVRDAQENMRRTLPKRFYKAASVGERDGIHHVLLDERAVKTPGQNALAFSTKAAADLIAGEFDAQGEFIDPSAMPCYRLSNTAIDGVATDMQAVLEDILRYCGTDMLFYRAEAPEGLVARQRALWDPLVEWAESLAGAGFVMAEGIVHQAQPRASIAAIGVHLNTIDEPVVMAALHSMTTLTGSALLALGVWKGAISAGDAWTAAHVDEDWNISHWGEDTEAKARRAARWREMDAADRLVKALSG